MSNQEAEMRSRIKELLHKQYIEGGSRQKKKNLINSNFNVANFVKKLSKKKRHSRPKKVHFTQAPVGSGALSGGRSKRHRKRSGGSFVGGRRHRKRKGAALEGMEGGRRHSKRRGAGALSGGRTRRRKRGGSIAGGVVGETKKAIYRPTEADLKGTSTARGATELDQLAYKIGQFPQVDTREIYERMVEQAGLKETEREFDLLQRMEDLRDEIQRQKIASDAEKDRMAMSQALHEASKLNASEESENRLRNARVRVRALQKAFNNIDQFRITNRIPSGYTETGDRVYDAPKIRSLGMPYYYGKDRQNNPLSYAWETVTVDRYPKSRGPVTWPTGDLN